MTERMNRIIKHETTQKTSILNYPEILSFIRNSFPDVDISSVPVYISDGLVMAKHGLSGMNGCYIAFLKTIFIRKDPNVCDNAKGKFAKILAEKIKCPLEIDDIVVHELLHAVSNHMERVNFQYVNSEEDFVFGNSVEYYRSKKMSDNDIINKVLIAFCVNNTLGNKKAMSKIFAELKQQKSLSKVPWEAAYSDSEYLSFMNKHADVISDILIEFSKEEGLKMLQSYDNARKRTERPSSFEFNNTGRFGLLDLEEDVIL